MDAPAHDLGTGCHYWLSIDWDQPDGNGRRELAGDQCGRIGFAPGRNPIDKNGQLGYASDIVHLPGWAIECLAWVG